MLNLWDLKAVFNQVIGTRPFLGKAQSKLGKNSAQNVWVWTKEFGAESSDESKSQVSAKSPGLPSERHQGANSRVTSHVS